VATIGYDYDVDLHKEGLEDPFVIETADDESNISSMAEFLPIMDDNNNDASFSFDLDDLNNIFIDLVKLADSAHDALDAMMMGDYLSTAALQLPPLY
jgi:hypothetical protein